MNARTERRRVGQVSRRVTHMSSEATLSDVVSEPIESAYKRLAEHSAKTRVCDEQDIDFIVKRLQTGLDLCARRTKV